jgi:ribonuclease BN (tRNA processing enzyme)
LVEAPPDIINSLFQFNIDYKKIKYIYISHVHGDHCFGFPFLMLRFFFDRVEGEIQVLGPSGMAVHLKEITRLSFGDDHPVNSWIKENIVFTEISHSESVWIGHEFEITPFPVFHLVETLAFKISRNSIINNDFIYLADSKWDDALLNYISDRKYIILCDMNGEPTDPVQIHISEQDILDKALPAIDIDTKVIGTHLKKNKTSQHRRIVYAESGDEIDI